MSAVPRTRPPAVAGSFYPADPRELAATVDSCLRAARPKSGAAPRAVIAPHAGYVYSGPVAGSAYAQVAPLREGIRRVVLIGPAHRVGFRGIAFPSAEAFETPLGVVPVNAAARELLRTFPQVVVRDDAHASEHSLEVQLPFLQRVLRDFSLVPLVVGEATDAEVEELLAAFLDDPGTLIVVSSDLSHYHDYEAARRIDAETSRAIEALSPSALDGERACGYRAVRGLLATARRRGLHARRLDLRNSGDTAGPRDQVVGYGAWAFEGEPASRKPSDYDDLVDVASASLRSGLAQGRALDLDPSAFADPLRAQRASFVTLRVARALRGCIGALTPRRPLVSDVAEHAFAAAFRDPRFPPLGPAEARLLDIHVSVLSDLEPMRVRSEEDLAAQLRPFVDGLLLEYGEHRATFLPSVWSELRSAEEFLAQLKRKAGLPADFWSPRLRLERYTVQEISRGAASAR